MRARTLSLLLGVAAFACQPEKPGSTPDDAEVTDDSAEPAAPDGSEVPYDITIEVSEDVVTVARVRWKTEAPTIGHAIFGDTDAYGRSSPPDKEASTEHEALLLGLWAETEFHVAVVTDGASGAVTSDDYTFKTGVLPSALPAITVTGEATWDGYVVAPLQGAGEIIAILDNQGRYVWYKIMDESEFFLMRSLLSSDRKDVVLCLTGKGHDPNGEGRIVRISLFGDEVNEITVNGMDHDMTQLPDGTYAAIVLETSPGLGFNADSIVEVSKDGSTKTTVWSAWDTLDPATDHPESLGSASWTHANAIDYDPEQDVYYLSLKEFGSLIKIDRASGQILWGLNGAVNDFAFTPGSEQVKMQHQFQIIDGGIVIFDNGMSDRASSQAVQYTLDEENMTADQGWTYAHDPPIWVFAKGDVHRFSNGNTLVTWSPAGEIQEVDPESKVIWQVNTDLGFAMTFVNYEDSLYDWD